MASNYGVPISSIQSSHSDGQWRLPNEVLEIKYHPLLGWGKVSHSGYHFIDMAIRYYIPFEYRQIPPRWMKFLNRYMFLLIL